MKIQRESVADRCGGGSVDCELRLYRLKYRRECQILSGHGLGHFRRPAHEIIALKLGVGGLRYLAALCGGQLGLAAVNDPNQLEFSRHDGDGYLNRHALIGERYLLIAEL